MYEPTLLEDETREQFLDRSWLKLKLVWKAMSQEEHRNLQAHAYHCDFPEKFSLLNRFMIYLKLATQVGFLHGECLTE